MSKRFRECSLDQPFLLPPSLHDWLPQDHLARFIAEIAETLDLQEIYRSYERKDGRGLAAYHPLMMTRLLLYGYAVGKVSSRQIERATFEDIAFRFLSADQHPDHDTIAHFRKQHLEALSKLFVQGLQLCDRAGLVKLGMVAIDGTKVQASASAAQSMRYKDLDHQEQRLRALVDGLLGEADRIDAEEDSRWGKGRRGDELPPELATAEKRLERIRQAKRELEQEAEQKAKDLAEQNISRRVGRPSHSDPVDQRSIQQREKDRKQLYRARREAKYPKRHYNFTDPDSRMVYDNGLRTVVQGYNAQLAVDANAQIILAADITQQVNDKQQLVPMVAETVNALGQVPEVMTADAGYWDTVSLQTLLDGGMNVLVSPDGRGGTGGSRLKPDHPLASQMRGVISSAAGTAIYRLRKAVVEPVIGHIKEQRGFRRFMLRGLRKVKAEWKLICMTHNLLKLYRHQALT